MKYTVEFDTEKSFGSAQNADSLYKIMHDLVSSYNTFMQIKDFLFENELFKKEYDKICEDMANYGGCGMGSASVGSLRELLYNLKQYEEEATYEDESCLRNENFKLKQENNRLKQNLQKIKNLL